MFSKDMPSAPTATSGGKLLIFRHCQIQQRDTWFDGRAMSVRSLASSSERSIIGVFRLSSESTRRGDGGE
jgi:hypothetical protein